MVLSHNFKLPLTKESYKSVAIVVLLTIVLLLSFKTRPTITNITTEDQALVYKLETSVDTITIANKVDWFLSLLGVFSTIFLGLVAYLIFNASKQQRQTEQELSEIKKVKNEMILMRDESEEHSKYIARIAADAGELSIPKLSNRRLPELETALKTLSDYGIK